MALVIGNSDYATMPPLPYCAASANVVSAALKRAGFEVTDRKNLSNGAMGVALGNFDDAVSLDPTAVAVAYVCGYALSYDGRTFLLPASANLQRPADVLTQGAVTGSLINPFLHADIRAGLLLLDNTAPPGRDAPLDLDHLVDPAILGTKGFAATDSTRPLPDGATPLATAFSVGLAPDEVELRALLATMNDALRATPNLTAVVYAPTDPVWLRGEPARRIAPAALPASATPAAPAADVVVTGPPSAAAALTDDDRRKVQVALLKLGYYAGLPDGIFGPETLAAIRRLQHELKADMTGKLSNEQFVALMRDAR
jgi:hypothetical protein